MNAVRRSQGKAIRQDSSHFHSELTICSDRLCRESCDSLSSSGLSVTAWTFSLTSLLFISMWSIPPYEMQKADGSKNKHWKLLKSGTSTQQNGKISKVMIIGVIGEMLNSADYTHGMKKAMYSASPEQSWYINIMFETNTLTSQLFIFYWNVWIRSGLIGGNASASWWEKKPKQVKKGNKRENCK